MTGPATVLVVEDDPTDRKLIRILLELEGYKVLACSSAEEALARLAVERPALLVLDLHLPGIGGLELAAKLRGDDRTRALPILAVSGSSGGDAAERASRAGCNAYLTKPVDVRAFPEAVARFTRS